jgi:hypothetical protein
MQGMALGTPLAMVLSLTCVLFGAGYVGCNGVTGSGVRTEERTGEAVLDREFKIKYGQELTVKGQDLKVTFASLLDDSRCPVNATCVWEGDAEILIGVRQAKGEGSQIALHTNQKFSQAGKYQQYVIRLVALDPYPRLDFEAKPGDYVATLLIKKG